MMLFENARLIDPATGRDEHGAGADLAVGVRVVSARIHGVRLALHPFGIRDKGRTMPLALYVMQHGSVVGAGPRFSGASLIFESVPVSHAHHVDVRAFLYFLTEIDCRVLDRHLFLKFQYTRWLVEALELCLRELRGFLLDHFPVG